MDTQFYAAPGFYTSVEPCVFGPAVFLPLEGLRLEGNDVVIPHTTKTMTDFHAAPSRHITRIDVNDIGAFDTVSGPRDRRLRELFAEREENLIRSAKALEQIYLATGHSVRTSPQVARSVQATENRWQAMEEEFGLLDSGQVAELLGSKITNRNRAHALANKGRILGIRRGRGILYPGFQFDKAVGEVRPEIAEVISIGRDAGWQDAHLLQWFCSPNGYLDGARPVDVLEDHDRLMASARQDLAERW